MSIFAKFRLSAGVAGLALLAIVGVSAPAAADGIDGLGTFLNATAPTDTRLAAANSLNELQGRDGVRKASKVALSTSEPFAMALLALSVGQSRFRF
jgi:hypothetical protein